MTKPVYIDRYQEMIKATSKAIKKAGEDFKKHPKKAKEFLLKLGFHTQTGKLKKKFQ